MNNKIKIFQAAISLLAVLIVIGIGIIIFRTYNSSKEALSPKTSADKSLKGEGTPSLSGVDFPEREKVKPSSPEDLGITVYYEDNKPKTQEEWNTFVAESYQKNRDEFEENYVGEFGTSPYGQLDNADLEEIDTNRVRLDEKISECEEKLKANPDDKDSKEKLENWRKFKALLITVYGEKSNVESEPR